MQYVTLCCTASELCGPKVWPEVGYGFGLATALMLNVQIEVYNDTLLDPHSATYKPTTVTNSTKTLRLKHSGNSHCDVFTDNVTAIVLLYCYCNQRMLTETWWNAQTRIVEMEAGVIVCALILSSNQLISQLSGTVLDAHLRLRVLI